MKSWPKNFTLKIFKSFMRTFFALIGIMTFLNTFILNNDQIRSEVVNSCLFALIVSLVFIYLDRNEWKEQLKQERNLLEKEVSTIVEGS